MTKSTAAMCAAFAIGTAAILALVARPVPAVAKHDPVSNTYSNLPITFVENRGQTDAQVRYFARGKQYAFFLTSNEVVLSLTRSTAPKLVKAKSADGIALALRFVGANPAVTIDGEDRAPGNVNYFRGGDQSKWHANVPNYTQVVYHELWPGIDLKLREKGGALKYEFHVRPGARVQDIRLAYRGADGLSLDPKGALLVETSLGTIRDAAPISFQEIDGSQKPVESAYDLDQASYGFRLGTGYRADRELVIDPGIEYSTFLGGNSNEVPTGIAVDGAGNTYVVGWTQSPDYPTTPGAFDRTGAASNFADVFVAKINPAGTALIYSTFIGGSDMDFGRAIAIDAGGNAYIAGSTKSSNFPTTGNAFDRTLNVLNCPRCGVDNTDAFVTKLNPTGSALVYSTYLGGATDIDDAFAIAVDAAGNAYVTGQTGSTDFPVTAAAFRRTRNAGHDAFITKLNAAGSALVYSTFLGGSQEEFAVRIKVDSSNNAYVLGNTSSADFPTTPGAFNTSANGAFDIFLLKMNATGSGLLYSTLLGGSDFDSAGGLAIDPAGDAYITGATLSANFPTTAGTLQPVCNSSDGFVAKFNPTASALVYSTCLPGAQSPAIVLTPSGNAWITGATSSTAFPVTLDAYQRFPASGSVDAFIAELNSTGSAFLYSTFLGGSQGDGGGDLGLDLAGNVYVLGSTMSPDFPITPNAFDRVFKGRADIFWGDAFIAKLSLNGQPPPPPGLPTVASVTTGLGVVGGNPLAINVTLSSGAQGSGAIVALLSSNPAILSVPATVTIPNGAQSAIVTASTAVVSADTPVTVSASYNSSSKAATVTVLPLPPPAALTSIGLFPNVVTGGQTTLAIIGLSNPAPAGGFPVALSTNNPIVTVPSTVTVPAGATTFSFNLATPQVSQTTGLTIFATAGGRNALAPLTLNPQAPPPPPPSSSALTVTATGRNGEHITSSPSGINVATGSSMQASFPSGTSITLSVTNGRDAVWSGACSSNGSKKKTCVFTLSGSATVSANVQ